MEPYFARHCDRCWKEKVNLANGVFQCGKKKIKDGKGSLNDKPSEYSEGDFPGLQRG